MVRRQALKGLIEKEYSLAIVRVSSSHPKFGS